MWWEYLLKTEVMLAVIPVLITMIWIVIHRRNPRDKKFVRSKRLSQLNNIMRTGDFIEINQDRTCVTYKYAADSKMFIPEVWEAKHAGFLTETIGINRVVKVYL